MQLKNSRTHPTLETTTASSINVSSALSGRKQITATGQHCFSQNSIVPSQCVRRGCCKSSRKKKRKKKMSVMFPMAMRATPASTVPRTITGATWKGRQGLSASIRVVSRRLRRTPTSTPSCSLQGRPCERGTEMHEPLAGASPA